MVTGENCGRCCGTSGKSPDTDTGTCVPWVSLGIGQSGQVGLAKEIGGCLHHPASPGILNTNISSSFRMAGKVPNFIGALHPSPYPNYSPLPR